MDSVARRLDEVRLSLEPELQAALAGADAPARLLEAMRYAVLGGGKRLRPALVVAACERVGGGRRAAWPGAVALELVHVYSLVHDDLPCMDDDDLRRGRPTVHKVFGDAMAVLVGDALQALAFEVLLRAPVAAELGAEAARVLALAAGAAGMVGGQALDLEGERQIPDLERVRTIHRRKTAALLRASLEVGAILGGADEAARRALCAYGEALGLAFQIVDDCLDLTSTPEELGKSPGKDLAAAKQTWPACVGIEQSRIEAAALAERACRELAALPALETKDGFLEDLALFVVRRRA